MSFWPLFGLNIEYGGNLKRMTSVEWNSKGGAAPSLITGFSDPAIAIWWVVETFLLLENPI